MNANRQVRLILRDERGAAYALSTLLTIPFYVAAISFAIEMCLLLLASHAMQAATVRALHTLEANQNFASETHPHGISLTEVIHESTVRSLLPFAPAPPGWRAQETSPDEALASLISDAGLSEVAQQRYLNKLTWLRKATRISLESPTDRPPGYLLTLEYDSPLWIPGLQRLLATGELEGQAVRTMRIQVWHPLDPATAEGTAMNLPFLPTQAKRWESESDES